MSKIQINFTNNSTNIMIKHIESRKVACLTLESIKSEKKNSDGR